MSRARSRGGRAARRLIGTRRIGGEHVPLEREGARAAPTAQPAVFAPAALAAELALAEPAEQRCGTPQLGEALRAQVARDLGHVRARRELPVRGDAAVLRAAGTAGLVGEDGGVGVGPGP